MTETRPALGAMHAPRLDAHSPMLASIERVLMLVFLFFSFNTSLRFIHGVIGPSELAMMALMAITLPRWRHWQWHRGAMVCWGVFMLALLCGWWLNPVANPAARHNLLAFVYAMGISMFLLAYLRSLARAQILSLLRGFTGLMLAVLALALALFVANALDTMRALGMNLAIPERLSLWADNPNQLAFAMVPLPVFMLCYLANIGYSLRRAVQLFLQAFLLFLVGFFIHSDALFLSWLIGLAALPWANYILKSRLRAWQLASISLAFVLAFGIFRYHTDYIMQLLPFELRSPFQAVQESPFGVGFGDNKAVVRSQLWKNSLGVTQQSPLVGFGPGAFSWIDQPDQIMEAHNTALDVLNQVGIIGLFACALATFALVRRAVLHRDALGLILLMMVFAFSVPHFIFRMPIWWFCLALAYAMAGHSRPPVRDS